MPTLSGLSEKGPAQQVPLPDVAVDDGKHPAGEDAHADAHGDVALVGVVCIGVEGEVLTPLAIVACQAPANPTHSKPESLTAPRAVCPSSTP